MSSLNDEKSESDGLRANRLTDTVNRLIEVRRRYLRDSAESGRSAPTENHLDSIISDLEGRLESGGQAAEIGDLDPRLAALEEMIEAVGFPGYARVVASIREGLNDAVEDSTVEEEPPAPRRYEPPPASRAEPAVVDADVDEWEIRAAALRSAGNSRWVIGSVLAVVGVAAVVLLFSSGSETEPPAEIRTEQAPAKVPQLIGPTAVSIPTPAPKLPEIEGEEEFARELSEEFTNKIELAEDAMYEGDLDSALRHFAAAAAIDRHHSRLTELAGSMIDALLKEADEAFDNSEWDFAAQRVEDARRIARGLYLDTSRIDRAARKHDDMTRFEDVTPQGQHTFSAAVGRSVRVTLTNGDVFFGRLEKIEGDSVLLEVHTGVEGGGMQYLKSIPLAMISELRIFEAERPSETFVGRSR